MKLKKEDYIGWEDCDMLTQLWKEAQVARETEDYPILRATPTPPANTGMIGKRSGITYVKMPEGYDSKRFD